MAVAAELCFRDVWDGGPHGIEYLIAAECS